MSEHPNWFETRLVAPRTWAIDDHGSDVIYLIAGNERALLLDTGWGVGDLPGLVASLTALPLLVVNTHGHPDHTFGNGQFDQVHIHPADEPLARTLPSPEQRQRSFAHLPKPLPEGFDLSTWATLLPTSVVPIQDGQTFDLGGRMLEAIALPGHSPGSICLLDRQARLLFTGDSIHSGTIWLHLDNSLPLRHFLSNLRRVYDRAGAFEGILPAHGRLARFPLPKQTLDDLIAGIGRILSGQIVGREEHTFAGDGLRCDFGSCSVIYRPDRL
jgi:hydroxyacylglutathione hydrolase